MRVYLNITWKLGLENSAREVLQGLASLSQQLSLCPTLVSLPASLFMHSFCFFLSAFTWPVRACHSLLYQPVPFCSFCFNFHSMSVSLTLSTREMITTENLFEPKHKVTSVWSTYGLSVVGSGAYPSAQAEGLQFRTRLFSQWELSEENSP